MNTDRSFGSAFNARKSTGLIHRVEGVTPATSKLPWEQRFDKRADIDVHPTYSDVKEKAACWTALKPVQRDVLGTMYFITNFQARQP